MYGNICNLYFLIFSEIKSRAFPTRSSSSGVKLPFRGYKLKQFVICALLIYFIILFTLERIPLGGLLT